MKITEYSKVKSKFIKEKINGLVLNSKNQTYIDDLIYIEKYASGNASFGLGTGYIRICLESKYPKEWKAIWMEINPEEWKIKKEDEIKEKELEKRENEKRNKEDNIRWKKEEKEWINAGGKL